MLSNNMRCFATTAAARGLLLRPRRATTPRIIKEANQANASQSCFNISDGAYSSIRLCRAFATSRSMASFYDLSAKTLDGAELKFSDLKGKVVLVENTASL